MKTLFILLFSLLTFLASGCGDNSDRHDEAMEEHTQETEMNDHQDGLDMMEGEHAMLDSSIIRDRDVDVASLDKNGDGNVYQCPMDYDVISDEHGTCPKCGMKLEEVSAEKAQQKFNNYMD